jgi:hypothetical protein
MKNMLLAVSGGDAGLSLSRKQHSSRLLALY